MYITHHCQVVVRDYALKCKLNLDQACLKARLGDIPPTLSSWSSRFLSRSWSRCCSRSRLSIRFTVQHITVCYNIMTHLRQRCERSPQLGPVLEALARIIVIMFVIVTKHASCYDYDYLSVLVLSLLLSIVNIDIDMPSRLWPACPSPRPRTAGVCVCVRQSITQLYCTRLDYTIHYTTLHYTTLHYTTLHYTTLHYTTLHYTTLPYTLHYTTLHYTTLRYYTRCGSWLLPMSVNKVIYY